MMKKFVLFILFACAASFKIHAQFTLISTYSDASITDLVVDGDTLIIVGYPNFFAKYLIDSDELLMMPNPNKINYENKDFQLVDDNYYLFSKQGSPYDYNYVLKSVDRGYTWDTLFNTPGLFYTFSMLDSTFGVLGGAYGSHAIANGSEYEWALQDSLYGVLTSSDLYGDSIVILEGNVFIHFL